METMKIKGMYGFGGFDKDVCNYMIHRFDLHLSDVGIEQAIKNYWRAAIEREDPFYNARFAEITVWKLERAITLREKMTRDIKRFK
jgi:hypothetical protein